MQHIKLSDVRLLQVVEMFIQEFKLIMQCGHINLCDHIAFAYTSF